MDGYVLYTVLFDIWLMKCLWVLIILGQSGQWLSENFAIRCHKTKYPCMFRGGRKYTSLINFAVVSVVDRVSMLVDGCNFWPKVSTWRIIFLVLKLSVYQRRLPFCYKDKWSKRCRSSRGTSKGRVRRS